MRSNNRILYLSRKCGTMNCHTVWSHPNPCARTSHWSPVPNTFTLCASNSWFTLTIFFVELCNWCCCCGGCAGLPQWKIDGGRGWVGEDLVPVLALVLAAADDDSSLHFKWSNEQLKVERVWIWIWLLDSLDSETPSISVPMCRLQQPTQWASKANHSSMIRFRRWFGEQVTTRWLNIDEFVVAEIQLGCHLCGDDHERREACSEGGPSIQMANSQEDDFLVHSNEISRFTTGYTCWLKTI